MASRPPVLVDHRGMPLQRAVLREEIAAPQLTGVRSILSGHPAQGLTPQRLTRLLLEAEMGDAIAYLELAEEMEEKDPHYLSVLATRKRQVAQLPIEVIPAGDSEEEKADAQLVRDWLDRDMLEFELFDILDAVGKGYSVTEIVWDTDELWLPRAMKWRDPRFFEFDRETGEKLLLRTAGPPEELAAFKFVTHVHPAKSGLPVRGGLARVAAWGYLFKNYAIKDWVSFLETYGMPMRVGRYPNGTSDTDIRKLMAALADLGSDAAAAFPDSMRIDFVDSKGGSAPNDLWRAKAEFVDLQNSKAVLGQTNTTDAQSGGLGSGQADVHNEVRGDIERADAKLLGATLQRDVVVPIVMLNRGTRKRYPRLRIGREDPVDVAALTQSAQQLVPLGVEVDADKIRDLAGLPAPKPGGRVLVVGSRPQTPENAPPAPEGPDMPQTASTAFLTPLKSQIAASALPSPADPVDDAAEEALRDWEQQIAPMLAPVEALVAQAADFDALKAGLASTIAAMDSDALVEMLARAMFAARLAGDVDARPQEDA
ncbi:MAG: DUF935 domain-containing protein [Pseudomonadota bacterium]